MFSFWSRRKVMSMDGGELVNGGVDEPRPARTNASILAIWRQVGNLHCQEGRAGRDACAIPRS